VFDAWQLPHSLMRPLASPPTAEAPEAIVRSRWLVGTAARLSAAYGCVLARTDRAGLD